MPIPCPPRVRGRALPRRGGRLGARLVPIKPRLEPPCAAQAEVVPEALEDRDHHGRRPRGLLQPALLAVEEPEELLLDEHMRRHALVVRGGSQPLRLVEHAPGLGQPAAFDQRGAELGEQRGPPRIVGGEQPGNPLEQADRRGQVAADERPPSRRLEPLGRPGGERGGARVARSERDAVPEGLLEVVADDLLELAQPVLGRQLEPGGEALVQVGARVLRQRAIGGVADQDMTEAVGLLAGEVGASGRIRSRRTSASRPSVERRSSAGQASSPTALR